MSLAANSADTSVNALPIRPATQVDNISIKDIKPVEMSPNLQKSGETWVAINLPQKVDPNAARVETPEEKTKRSNMILAGVAATILIVVIAIAVSSSNS